MSMIICNECGKEISDKAQSCPNCGNPINIVPIQPQSQKFAKKQSFLGICAFIFSISFFLSIIGFLLGILDLYKNDKSKKHSCSILSIIISLFWFVLLCSLGTPIENDEEEPTIDIQETIIAEDNTTISNTNDTLQEEIIVPETTTINTELTEDEYKAQCKELYYDDVFFEDDLLSINYVKLHLMISESYYFKMDTIYNSSFSELMDKWSLYRDFYKCSVLRQNENSYAGVGKIDLYFSSNYELNPDNYDLGNKVIVYGEVISFSKDYWDGYNNVIIIPKYIENE